MQENNISSNNFENCLKCNICAQVCPMMEVNPHYPGPKQAGPDGERYRLKDPAFYDLTLKYCLNCKRCEVSCPSGVKVGDIIQIARLRYGSKTNYLRDFALSHTDLVGSVATIAAPVVNGTLKLKPVKKIMNVMGVDEHRTFPEYSSAKFVNWFRNSAPSQDGYSRFVSYFHGCYVNYNYPQLGKDLVTLMNAFGYGVKLLEDEKCCGVAMISNGFGGDATKNAKTNVASIGKALKSSEAVLTSGSTCTFTMRDEYDHVLGIDTSEIRSGLLLATKWIFDQVESGKVKLAFKQDYKMKAAYHTACHINKLGWGIYSISLLKMIPGMDLTVLDQECCGIAGTFGFKKENYEYSQNIGSKLFANIKAADPQVVATDCETCKWQIEMSTGRSVKNPLSILAEALDIEKTTLLNNGR